MTGVNSGVTAFMKRWRGKDDINNQLVGAAVGREQRAVVRAGGCCCCCCRFRTPPRCPALPACRPTARLPPARTPPHAPQRPSAAAPASAWSAAASAAAARRRRWGPAACPRPRPTPSCLRFRRAWCLRSSREPSIRCGAGRSGRPAAVTALRCCGVLGSRLPGWPRGVLRPPPTLAARPASPPPSPPACPLPPLAARRDVGRAQD